MRRVGRYVEEIAGVHHDVVRELFPIPHAGHTAEGVNGGFVSGVLMRLGSRPGRDGHDLKMNAAGPCGLGGDAGRVPKGLLALKLLTRTEQAAGRKGGWGSLVCHASSF